jgi:hypothetical protein
MRLGDGSVGYGLAFPMLKGRDVVGVGVLAVDLAETLDGLASKINSEVILAVAEQTDRIYGKCTRTAAFGVGAGNKCASRRRLKLVVPSWRLP